MKHVILTPEQETATKSAVETFVTEINTHLADGQMISSDPAKPGTAGYAKYTTEQLGKGLVAKPTVTFTKEVVFDGVKVKPGTYRTGLIVHEESDKGGEAGLKNEAKAFAKSVVILSTANNNVSAKTSHVLWILLICCLVVGFATFAATRSRAIKDQEQGIAVSRWGFKKTEATTIVNNNGSVGAVNPNSPVGKKALQNGSELETSNVASADSAK